MNVSLMSKLIYEKNASVHLYYHQCKIKPFAHTHTHHQVIRICHHVEVLNLTGYLESLKQKEAYLHIYAGIIKGDENHGTFSSTIICVLIKWRIIYCAYNFICCNRVTFLFIQYLKSIYI